MEREKPKTTKTNKQKHSISKFHTGINIHRRSAQQKYEGLAEKKSVNSSTTPGLFILINGFSFSF